MELEEARAFVEDAKRAGLLIDERSNTPSYEFYLNDVGWVYTRQSPEAAWNFLKAARAIERDGYCGMHQALLGLVATRSELTDGRKYVSWSIERRGSDIEVTFAEFLRQRGYDLSEVA